MVYVTSPLNDLGDVSGDKEAGKRKIPIVIGKRSIVTLSILITLGMTTSIEYAGQNVYISTANGLVLSLTSLLTVALT